MIDVDWVTNPRFWHRVPRDAKMAAVELQVASTMESPAGSLPSDDEGLALAAGLLSDVDAWRRVADLALRGWTLCADGRYYRADVAKKMLHVWIVRLNDRRRGAAGQAKRRKEDFDPSQFDADIAIAVACMTRLDPYAPILRNYRNAQPDVDAASATAPSNAPSNSKLSEAKLSEAESSSPRRGDDSSENPDDPVLEIGSEGRFGKTNSSARTRSALAAGLVRQDQGPVPPQGGVGPGRKGAGAPPQGGQGRLRRPHGRHQSPHRPEQGARIHAPAGDVAERPRMGGRGRSSPRTGAIVRRPRAARPTRIRTFHHAPRGHARRRKAGPP